MKLFLLYIELVLDYFYRCWYIRLQWTLFLFFSQSSTQSYGQSNAARNLVCACLNRIKQRIYVIFVSLSSVKVLCRFLVTGNCGMMCLLPSSSSSSSSFYSFQFHCVFDVQYMHFAYGIRIYCICRKTWANATICPQLDADRNLQCVFGLCYWMTIAKQWQYRYLICFLFRTRNDKARQGKTYI